MFNGPENAAAGRDAEHREPSLAEVLGIEIEYAPEELAPPIDRAKLRAFIDRSLTGDEREEVLAMIATFRSWHEAWLSIRREMLPPHPHGD